MCGFVTWATGHYSNSTGFAEQKVREYLKLMKPKPAKTNTPIDPNSVHAMFNEDTVTEGVKASAPKSDIHERGIQFTIF